MKEERSFVYTLILGICMLISLLLIGRMLLGHSEPQNETDQAPLDTAETSDGEGRELHLSENDICTMIVQALPFSPDGITVKISRDATVSLSASVRKSNLLDTGVIPGNMRTALLFLPNICKIYAVWNISVSDAALCLQCATIEVGGYALPNVISSKITEQIEAHFNQQLTEWEIQPGKIEFDDGCLILYPTS